jgi:hypothetical protein
MQASFTRLAILLALAALAACAQMHRGTQPHNDREFMTGPGLFTGPSGEWTILDRHLPAAQSRARGE